MLQVLSVCSYLAMFIIFQLFHVLYRLADVLSFPWVLSSGDQVSYSEVCKY